jgi:hypothetical protein
MCETKFDLGSYKEYIESIVCRKRPQWKNQLPQFPYRHPQQQQSPLDRLSFIHPSIARPPMNAHPLSADTGKDIPETFAKKKNLCFFFFVVTRLTHVE